MAGRCALGEPLTGSRKVVPIVHDHPICLDPFSGRPFHLRISQGETIEGQTWRNEMQALVDAEAPGGDRRERLIGSFNRGYRGFQQTYRTCTPAANLAIRRYLDEGAKIARDITARYAN